jgi:hypothetical protein
MLKRFCILAMVTACLLLSTQARADDPEVKGYEAPALEIEAYNDAGYLMLASYFDYFTVDYSKVSEANRARAGWSWFSSGEPLLFEHDGPLSNAKVDPLNPGSCPIGADPLAMSAFISTECIVRLPGTLHASLVPCYPIGRFYRASLPDGGAAWVRSAAAAPALTNLVARLNGTEYRFEEVEPLSVLLELQQGEPAHDRSEQWGLEEAVANADAQSLLAYHGKGDRREAMHNARATAVRMLEHYRERHGSYPAKMAALTAIPGAVCAALPHSPWDFTLELGLATPDSVGNGDLLYLPSLGEDGRPEGYRLLIISNEAWQSAEKIEVEGLARGLNAY